MKPLTIEELKALPVGGWVWLKILKIINIVAEDNGIAIITHGRSVLRLPVRRRVGVMSRR